MENNNNNNNSTYTWCISGATVVNIVPAVNSKTLVYIYICCYKIHINSC